MKIARHQIFEKKEKYFVILLVLAVAAVIVTFVGGISRWTVEGNVVRRVNDESQFLAKQQAELINKVIEEQFDKVSTISGMMEKGLSFYDEKDRKILQAFVEKNNIRTLGYIDKKGNAIDYRGKVIGDVSDRTYFKNVITGKSRFVCQYLETTEFGDIPRIIFSTVFYENGNIKGVVFYSKDTDLLRENLFQQSMFDDMECSVVVDRDGDIIVKNERAEEKHPTADNINDICENSNKLMQHFKSVQSGSILWGDDKEKVFSYASIEQNDWYLICLVDTDVARHEYAPNLIAIRRSITLLATAFLFGIFCFGVLVILRFRNSSKVTMEYKMQYERVLGLLQKMKCMLLEYDIKTGKILTNHSFDAMFGEGLRDDFFERIPEHKARHPEFDYDGLIRELNHAIEYKVTTSFDSIYCADKFSYKMLSIVMMPLIEKGQVTNVFGSIRETSAEHLQMKEKIDMFSQIPGGTYRYYLSEPVHLEYAGKKLCKMIGYTVEEFYENVGRYYSRIIVKEDRKKYRRFIQEAASSPGVRGCRYRIQCKNGEILPVLDTMESIQNDSGSMYGYSVVLDISEYVKRQNIVRQELKQLEQNLEMMRVQNSTSQMQPHFLYNALSSIREVILIDPQYASNLICDFTVYLRACIKTMQNGEQISIRQEMDNIKAYVNIEKMRMGNRLNVTYDLTSEEFQVVPLSIQPLVENAIRHGIYRKGRKGGTVSIRTETLEKYNLITIKDDGVGFDYQKVRDEVERGERDSIGLDNVIFRLKKQLHANIVIKSEIGVGTEIAVSVPRERKKE